MADLSPEKRERFAAAGRQAWRLKSQAARDATRDRLRAGGRAWWEGLSEAERAAFVEKARDRSRQAWRDRFPERAAIRDELLATNPPEPCACGDPDAVLFVTDYEARAFVWRCRACAAAERARWRGGTA